MTMKNLKHSEETKALMRKRALESGRRPSQEVFDKKRNKIEDVRREVEESGWKLTGDYINSKTKLELMCENGHIIYRSLSDFRRNKCCTECRKNNKKTRYDKFITRNRRRNKHLYEDGKEEGFDYVVCPESNERLSMIKSSYIEKILGMTVEEYDKNIQTYKKSVRKELIT